MKVSLSRVQLLGTPRAVALQTPPSLRFSRQEYCGGLPFPTPGYFSHPGLELVSPTLKADSLLSEPPGKPRLSSFRLYNNAVYSSPCFPLLALSLPLLFLSWLENVLSTFPGRALLPACVLLCSGDAGFLQACFHPSMLPGPSCLRASGASSRSGFWDQRLPDS